MRGGRSHGNAAWARGYGPGDGREWNGLPEVRVNSSRGVVRVELWYGLPQTSMFRPSTPAPPPCRSRRRGGAGPVSTRAAWSS
ncbi:MAG TPA: hypothetical protein VFB66_12890 [Tepidisphaeraceae bacterium]|nr:hypothetical protein [Tepidisphaeraceae bacterium]